MKTLYAVTPKGEVLGVAARMKDMRWVFTPTGGSPGSRSYPIADACMPLSVRQRATLIDAKDEREASFKARQTILDFGGLVESPAERRARESREKNQDPF